MVTRIGGLASGMDIDSIVEKLMSAEKAPLNKLYQQQQKYEWQRDAYREINTALKSFDDFLFDGYRLSSNFYKKNVTSSNSSLVTSTALSSATGTLQIDGVTQLATSAKAVGTSINATGSKKLSDLNITSTSIKLNAIQENGKMLDKAVEIKLDTNETVDSFVRKINASNVGVTALFENGKLSISAKYTGNNSNGGEVIVESGSEVFKKLGFGSVTDGGALADGGKNAIFSVNGISTVRSSNTFTLNGYTVTLNGTFNVDSTINDYKTNTLSNYNNSMKDLKDLGVTVDTATSPYTLDESSLTTLYSSKKTAVSQSELAYKNTRSELSSDLVTIYNSISQDAKTFLMNTADLSTVDWSASGLSQGDIDNLQPLTTDQLENLKGTSFTDKLKPTYNSLTNNAKSFLTNLSAVQLESLANETDLTVLDDSSGYGKISTLKPEDLESLETLSKDELINLKQQRVNEVYDSLPTSAKNLLGKLDAAELDNLANSTVDLSVIENLNSTNLPELEADEINELKKLSPEILKSFNNLDKEAFTTINNIELSNSDFKAKKSDLTTFTNAKTRYEDAKKEYNESLSLTPVGDGGNAVPSVTLTSSTDIESMVDKIKKFVETYNGLVTTINGKLKESYNRNYSPLTEEQKEDMSDDEIEKWEAKAKTGLLRNDSLLTSGLYGMRSTFMDSVGGLGDATINSLAEIGITTSSTTSDGGKLVIDEDKLKKAIETNSDQVAAIFTKTGTAKDPKKGITEDTRGIAQRLRDELKKFTSNIEEKAGKTSSTNETFTIGKRLEDIEDRIDRWKDKLQDIESRYWRQFTAMEQAINKANQQSSLFMPAQ